MKTKNQKTKKKVLRKENLHLKNTNIVQKQINHLEKKIKLDVDNLDVKTHKEFIKNSNCIRVMSTFRRQIHFGNNI